MPGKASRVLSMLIDSIPDRGSLCQLLTLFAT